MTKTRVYDLAKQYGMTGQELATKLRDLGFSQVKSHMTALTDFEMIEIQGRLEAYGIVGESRPDEAGDNLGGLVIKKRPKPKSGVTEETEEAPPAKPAKPAKPAASEPPAVAHEERLEAPPVPTPPLAEAAPEPEPEPAPRFAETEPTPPPVAEPLVPAAESEVAETAELGPESAEEVEPALETVPDETADSPLELMAEEEADLLIEALETEPVVGDVRAKDENGDIVRPTARRRPGKVVGFIDLSKIQAKQEPKRTQSRRLSSSDDVAPDVQPTMGRDRARAFQRGDHGQRGALTAAQLRERESSRYLRRRPVGGPRQPGARPSTGGRPATRGPLQGGSPYSGSMVEIEEPFTVKKLADALSIKASDLLKIAGRELGFGSVNINSLLDADTATLLANEFGVELKVSKNVEAEELLLEEFQKRRDAIEEVHLEARPPVVCFLGHVDHGKTTLIDAIRRTKITEGESGGITQHIGAYQVSTALDHKLAIVDTPGHAAFTAMRARGAQAVDVAVLVVAADDGVMPQTEEAVQHARAAGVPIVVALNKIDKPGANPERVKTQLSNLGLQPEEWGGEVAVMPVSGLTGEGVDELLERVVLESEVLELSCHPDGPASGIVLEAEIQKGKGKVAHLLVQDGSLKQGDVILAGKGYGKVRSITNDRGKSIREAGPSTPVEVSGLNELPNVGDHFHVIDSLDQAREVALERGHKQRMVGLAERREVTNTNILEAVAEQDKEFVNLVVRADVQGSVEVLKQQLSDLTHDEVVVKVILSGVGEVVESDVDLAATSNATVIAFHVGVNSEARQAAERHRVEIRNFNVIYELLDYVKARMESSLSPEFNEQITGHAEVRQVFKSSKFGSIAGCFVLDGAIQRDNKARLLRDGVVVHTGALSGLRRIKDDVREVREGYECGILLRDYNDINEGDVIEAFKMVESRRLLDI